LAFLALCKSFFTEAVALETDIEAEGIIIGLVGARFERSDRMVMIYTFLLDSICGKASTRAGAMAVAMKIYERDLKYGRKDYIPVCGGPRLELSLYNNIFNNISRMVTNQIKSRAFD